MNSQNQQTTILDSSAQANQAAVEIDPRVQDIVQDLYQIVNFQMNNNIIIADLSDEDLSKLHPHLLKIHLDLMAITPPPNHLAKPPPIRIRLRDSSRKEHPDSLFPGLLAALCQDTAGSPALPNVTSGIGSTAITKI
jgi:hypothetical protein